MFNHQLTQISVSFGAGYVSQFTKREKKINLRDKPKFYSFVITFYARVAQLVEHNLAKVGVASSNLVSRSKAVRKLAAFFVLGLK